MSGAARRASMRRRVRRRYSSRPSRVGGLIDRIRRGRMNAMMDGEEALEDIRFAERGNDGEIRVEAERAAAVVARLRPEQRKVLRMGLLEGMTHSEIANGDRDAAGHGEDADAAWPHTGTAVDEDRQSRAAGAGDALRTSSRAAIRAQSSCRGACAGGSKPVPMPG